MTGNCIFCADQNINLVCENRLAKALYDKYPVNKGHVLIVPKRHISSYFEATPEEVLAINELISRVKIILDERYKPDGYNVGVNDGAATGITKVFPATLKIRLLESGKLLLTNGACLT